MSRLPVTEGALQLAAAGAISDVARRLGVADRSVVSWRTGRVVPSDGSRQTIKRVLGIEPSAFDRAVPVAIASSNPADEPDAPERLTSTGGEAGAPESAEQRLRAQLERLRQQRESATGRQLVELEKLELAASRALARAEGVELDGRRIAKSKAWLTLEEIITKALEPFPDALAAVARATGEHGNGAS